MNELLKLKPLKQCQAPSRWQFMRFLQNTCKAIGEWGALSESWGSWGHGKLVYTDCLATGCFLQFYPSLLQSPWSHPGQCQHRLASGSSVLQAPAELETPMCVCVCVCVCVFYIPVVSNGRLSRRKSRYFSPSAHSQELWAHQVTWGRSFGVGMVHPEPFPPFITARMVPSSCSLCLSHPTDNASRLSAAHGIFYNPGDTQELNPDPIREHLSVLSSLPLKICDKG